jgi:hypothetical protein
MKNFKQFINSIREQNFDFDKILKPNDGQNIYKTSAKSYSDKEFLKAIWMMPEDKLKSLIELLEKDKKTASELGRGRGVMTLFYKKDKLYFESYLKWAKETLTKRLKDVAMPEWLK